MYMIPCNRYVCPGFYRCRSSKVCVHLSQLCDGWPQCPQRDDEWLCDSTCPHPHCRCQGWAFVCRTAFAAHQHLQLRYLDASWSGMTLHNLSLHVYLVRLHMRWCGLTELTAMDSPNMQILDLSHNQLTAIHLDQFLPLSNLHSLQLASNPMVAMTTGTSKSISSVTDLDISHTRLAILNNNDLIKFVRLQVKLS